MNTALTFASLCQDKEVAEGTFKRGLGHIHLLAYRPTHF